MKPRNYKINTYDSSANYVKKLTADTKNRSRRRNAALRWTLIAFVICLLGIGVFYGGQKLFNHCFYSNDAYKIIRIDTNLPDNILTREEALDKTGLHEGLNIFAADLDKARRTLEAIPMVESAHIERNISACTLGISIVPRKLIAWLVQNPEENFSRDSGDSFVDSKGNILRLEKNLQDYISLPIISGVKFSQLDDVHSLARADFYAALDLLDLVRRRPDTLLKIQTIDITRGWAMEITTPDKSRIIIESENIPAQLDRLETLLIHCASTGRTIKTANLAVKRNIPVTFTVAASTESLDRALAAIPSVPTARTTAKPAPARATSKPSTKPTSKPTPKISAKPAAKPTPKPAPTKKSTR